MIPGEYNITIYKGTTWSITINSKDESGVLINFEEEYINTPNIGSGNAKMQIRPTWIIDNKDSIDPPLYELSTNNGLIVIDQTNIILTINALNTISLDFSTGVYDLILSTGDTPPIKDKLIYGTVTVIEGVTV